ncbi:MAG: hypothetical protein RBG1_1C00001G1281 [candidate division Zixibacteria bacterium RBG-1]|nr:MAG: hypothetical protein RBG1_1C00001G1281 [candidate division Zixibacteria bacterium RBG-1]OGC86713.1 MAG: hypothetical protein A2V73_06135 [candidate division Zixibacteria bacterium RBG_19FT_COMBO_42_43]
MPEDTYPTSTNLESLLNRYKRLKSRYKTILDLAGKIMFELENSGSERLIKALLEEKIKIAEKIQLETDELSLHPIPQNEVINSQIIREAKEIIADIKIMLGELYEREETISEWIKKSGMKFES